MSKGDILVFFVTGTNMFRGTFRIVSDWHRAKKPLWPDEVVGQVLYQCDLEIVQMDDAVYSELIQRLNFVTNKAFPYVYLRDSPGNFGRPIDRPDYEIILEAMRVPTSEVTEEKKSMQHEDIVSKIVELGASLGFEPSTNIEDTRMAKGAVVDAVWTVKVTNLGLIRYVFEVQGGGSIDSLVMNLMRAMNNPSVRKLVVVSDAKQLDSIRGEVSELPESFRKNLVLVGTKEVLHAHQLLTELNSFRSKLGLLA